MNLCYIIVVSALPMETSWRSDQDNEADLMDLTIILHPPWFFLPKDSPLSRPLSH